MARDIHNKKTTMFNSVYDDYNKQKLKWDQDIKEYNSGKIHPNNLSLTDSISIDSISIDSPELDSIIDSGKFKQNPISNYVENNNRCKYMKKDEDIFLHIKSKTNNLISKFNIKNFNKANNSNEEEIDKIIIDGTDEKRRRVYKLFFPKFISPEVLKKIEII